MNVLLDSEKYNKKQNKTKQNKTKHYFLLKIQKKRKKFSRRQNSSSRELLDQLSDGVKDLFFSINGHDEIEVSIICLVDQWCLR